MKTLVPPKQDLMHGITNVIVKRVHFFWRFASMVSHVDRAERALVILLKALAVTYVVSLVLSRESDDAAIRSAFRKVSRKAHPDQGGSVTDQQQLNDAYGGETLLEIRNSGIIVP